MRELFQKFKIKIELKDLVLWFLLSFVGVLCVYIFVMKSELTLALLLQTIGFSIVFVLMMIGTKSYNQYINGFYQSHIDRQNKKDRKKRSKTKKVAHHG